MRTCLPDKGVPVSYLAWGNDKRSDFVSDLIKTCQWMRVMLDDVAVQTVAGLIVAKYWQLPHTNLGITFIGPWCAGYQHKLIVHNISTNAVSSIMWRFIDDKKIEILQISEDISMLITGMHLLNMFKCDRYRELNE